LSLVNRISNGLVLIDKFDSNELNPIWQVSPSDNTRYSLTEKPGYLRMKHGDPDLFILMNSPRFDFVFEVDTSYVPERASDSGGITAFRDQQTRIELLEYYDPTTGTTKGYDRLRMVRQADLFSGYGSNDNGKTWELIGISYLSAPKIGMVLHGIQEAQSDNLNVSEVRMYRDTTVQVGNLVPGQKVRLVDSAGKEIGNATCKADTDYAKIDCFSSNYPLTGKVQIYDTVGFLLDETEILTDIWGGDIFWYGVKLDLMVDNVLMRQDREYQLGNMESGVIERLMYVINNNDIPLYNVRCSVQAMSEYYGWEWTDVAGDLYGFPNAYSDSILIGTIKPGEQIPIWCKVTRRPYQQMASLQDYKFRLMFESG
jgi:hypothetical protein